MRIAALQTDIVWENPTATFKRVAPQIAAAGAQGAELIALPEMFACGFSMATDRIAEPPNGPSTRFLSDQARKHGCWIAGSIPELDPEDGKPANTMVVAGPCGERHRYRKIHPFSHAREDQHYQAGSRHVTIEIEGLRITLFICYDLRFADEFWTNASTTDAYLVIANWPEARREHWTTLLRARAIENQAYVVGVNRVGNGGKLRYTGDSRIVDPNGRVLAAAANQEAILVADLDPAVVQATREALPFLRDRR